MITALESRVPMIRASIYADVPHDLIAMKTRTALMTTGDVSTSEFDIVRAGLLTPPDKLPAAAEKTRARQLAMKVGGVKTVKSLL